MAMADILPTLILIALVWVVLRYFFGSKTQASTDSIQGVTPAMVASVHSAFPSVPVPNIIYHLSKTRSSQATSEEILERGSLPNPPPTFLIPPSLLPPTVNPPSLPTSPTSPGRMSMSSAKPPPSLIERYGLVSRLPSRKGKEKEAAAVLDPGAGVGPGGEAKPAGGAKWEDTREKRERELRERKERMVLEARRRLLEKQAAQGAQ